MDQDLQFIRQCIIHGQFLEAKASIEKLPGEDYVEGQILLSQIFEREGNIAYALQAVEEVWDGCTTPRLQLLAITAKAYAFLRFSRYEQTGQMLAQANALLDSWGKVKDDEIRSIQATLLNIAGIAARYQGHLKEALEFYKESLWIREDLGLQHDIGISLMNIGIIDERQGNVEKALETHFRALEIFVALDNPYLIASSFHAIANVYFLMGEFPLALEYEDRALNLQRQNNNVTNMAGSILTLVLIHLELGNKQEVAELVSELQQLSQTTKIKQVEAYYQITQALQLRSTGRLMDAAKAQMILQRFMQQEVIHFDLTNLASITLFEILIQELKIYGNPEILEEIKLQSEQLVTFAESQHSNPLLAEIYLMQSKLALVNLDIELAQTLMRKAESLALEKELRHIAIKTSLEYDLLLDKLSQWEDLRRRDASLLELIEESKLEDVIKSFSFHKNQQDERQGEESVLFMILDPNGITLYAHTFQHTSINPQIIGGFLIASNMGLSHALDTKKFMERIKHGDYNILFKEVNDIIFCYTFKGQPYSAATRLNRFIESLNMSNNLWEVIKEPIPKPRKIAEVVNDLVDIVFSSD